MPEGSAASASHRPSRRRFLVDRGFQLKYALVMAAAGVAVAVIFGLWLTQAHTQALDLLQPTPETRAAIERSDHILAFTFVVIAVALAAALGLLGVVITHRVAGPVYVMSHYLTVLAEGRFPRMRTLRRSDELKAFFRVFIDAVEALKSREIRHLADLEQALMRMRAALPRAPELAPVIEALEAEVAERRRALAAEPELTPIAVERPRTDADAA
ncbi:MAG: hypothetical protein QM767_06365 [Anaeromyxobacter sp.]